MPTQVDWAPDTSEEGQQACAIPCAGLASRTKQNQAGFISDKLGLLAAAARVVDADAVSEVEAKHKLVDSASGSSNNCTLCGRVIQRRRGGS